MKKISIPLTDHVPSPALILDPCTVESNIETMISIAGDQYSKRLRPHLKTHKMSEVTKLHLSKGINKFKASTIKEAEMAAQLKANDILLAHQPTGPNIKRLNELVNKFPKTSFASIIDNITSAKEISETIGKLDNPFRLFIDINCGMNRTGIPFSSSIKDLKESIINDNNLIFSGYHIYDGHLHQPSIESRKKSVIDIKEKIFHYLSPTDVDEIIVGGSPTFAIWAELSGWSLSPGTTTLWDMGYLNSFPDLNFNIAAFLLTRVISKPADNLLCFDLGHKSVASENPLQNRVFFPDIKEYTVISQSEEHLVIKTPSSHKYKIGDSVIGWPQHICPTVALHRQANLIIENKISVENWQVSSRDRI